MKLVYISHPYTGNEAENVLKMRECCRKIKNQHKDWALFNPLDNHIYAHNRYSYQDFIDMDMAILSKCDIAVFCGEWEHSKGCMKEYNEAKRLGLKVYFVNGNQ